jgi:hypothetical protein
MTKSTQKAYAGLLKSAGLGEALYYPSTDVRIGDVGYFTDTTYHCIVNVFELSEEVLPSCSVIINIL